MTAAVNMRVCMCVSSQPGLYTFTITWTQDGELTNGQKILATERQNGQKMSQQESKSLSSVAGNQQKTANAAK